MVDHDVVTVDNIYRQDYVRTDIGKKKVDVLKSRASRCLSIDSIDKMITGLSLFGVGGSVRW